MPCRTILHASYGWLGFTPAARGDVGWVGLMVGLVSAFTQNEAVTTYLEVSIYYAWWRVYCCIGEGCHLVIL